LRGIAALCVVVNHLVGIYWAVPALVAATTFTLVQTLPAPGFFGIAAQPSYNLGPFGVAMFFLISGFVIPLSLEGQTAIGFLVARAFRIFPTYLVAFTIELGVIAVSAHVWHRPLNFSAKTLFANLFLATDLVDAPTLDLVNWTLTVELKFYLLVAALAPLIRRGNVLVIVALSALILIVTRFSHEIFLMVPAFGVPLRIFESNALYVSFMIIGIIFSYHQRGLIRGWIVCVVVPLLFAAFAICWPMTFFRGEYPAATINYCYALAVFSFAYVFRHFVRANRVIDALAAVSYPLYLVHAVIGFTLITVLTARGLSPLVSTLIAFAAVIALAAVLHVAMEVPSQRFGKRLGQRFAPRPTAVRDQLPDAHANGAMPPEPLPASIVDATAEESAALIRLGRR